MLTKKQQELYGSFYRCTHDNEFLDSKTEVLIGLAAAIAMNCKPCTNYYLGEAKKQQVVKGEISEVIAKVMAVAAGQKRLQTAAVISEFDIDLDSYK